MLSRLPAINACLNGSAAALLVLGWALIRSGRRLLHRACMLLALACSTAFLAGYLYYHAHAGVVRYAGAWRGPYLAILLTHTVLAALIVPLVLRTFYLAARERFETHRRWARWTMPLWLYVSVTGVIIYLMLFGGTAHAAEASLAFKRSGKPVAELSVSQLAAKVQPKTLTYFDPHYGKPKTFKCFPIKDVMRAGFGASWQDGVHTQAALVASDGYTSQSAAAKLSEDGGCLAFADAEYPAWEPVGRKAANPAPFYLFWTGAGQSTENAYPWPWQLVAIDLVRFSDAYPEVVPTGAPEGSPAYRGFVVFRDRCLRCHAINQQGGKIGPDLNAPMPIVKYRTKAWLKSWIKQPSKYRYTEMPDHLDLTDGSLEDLYAYFSWKAKQPEKKAF